MATLLINGPKFGLVGSHIKFESIIESPPSDLTYLWYKDGILVPQYPMEDTKSLILYDIGYPSEGEYFLQIVSSVPEFNLTSNKINFKIGLDPDEPEDPDIPDNPDDPDDPNKDIEICPFIHSNPLPQRKSVYIWMGWWVIDEIIKAKEDGFDWHAAPDDKRFRYKCDLAYLASLIDTHDQVDVQESRDGYILNKEFFL